MSDVLTLFSVEDRVAVVTGAGSGIGAEVAYQLCALGAYTVLVDIDGTRLAESKKRLENLKGRCLAVPCDVTDENQVNKLRDDVLENFGKIHILVNSHGISRRASADEITAEQFDVVIDVNLRGAFLTTSILGRVMLKQGDGSIINVSSIAAHVSMANNVNYAAAKGGLEAMTRSFAGEWASRGVRVNAIAPGPCKTPFTETLYDQPGYVDQLLEKIPRRMISTPAELIGSVLLLASDAGQNIIGQTLVVDGGFTII